MSHTWLWEEGKAVRGGPSAPYNDQEPCGGQGGGGVQSVGLWDRQDQARGQERKGRILQAQPASWVTDQSQLCPLSLSHVATLFLEASWSTPQWRTAALGRFLQVLPSWGPQSKAKHH